MTEEEFLILIGNNITRLRKKKEITSNELALNCDMEKSNMIAIEKGRRNVTAKTLFKIAKELDCEVKDFFKLP